MSANDWFGGKTATPPLISLKGLYDGGEANELPASEQKKAQASTPIASAAPTKTEVEPPKPKAAPVPEPVIAERAKPTELKENKQAMAAMASKFADKEESSEDDASSFEEIPKPVTRPVRETAPLAAKAVAATTPAVSSSYPRSAAPVTKQADPPAPVAAAAPTPAASEPTTSRAPTSGLAEGLKAHFTDIKTAQNSQLSEISELKGQVKELTDLVRQLSSRLDSFAGSQSERIRRVELDVENLGE
jgi:coronin-1B/1C/6